MTDSSTRPEVSVIMPIRNEKAHIRETVRAALDQQFGGSMEFLFVDGDSDDGTTEVLRTLAEDDDRCRLLRNTARLTPHALNIGLRHAQGRLIVRMDAHTYYPPDYVERAVERLRRGDVTWVTGPALPRGQGHLSTRVEAALRTWLGVGGATFRKEIVGEMEVDTGFAGIMERETLEALGGWDEDWPINQDAELAARVRESGGRIVCIPEMAAAYVPRDSLRGLARQYWRYGRYRVKTAVRHPNSVRVTHLLPPGLAMATVVAVARPARRSCLVARAALAVYALTVTATSIRHLRRPSDAAVLPAVFATMHLSFGFGVLAGLTEHGIPAAGVAQAVRFRLES